MSTVFCDVVCYIYDSIMIGRGGSLCIGRRESSSSMGVLLWQRRGKPVSASACGIYSVLGYRYKYSRYFRLSRYIYNHVSFCQYQNMLTSSWGASDVGLRCAWSVTVGDWPSDGPTGDEERWHNKLRELLHWGFRDYVYCRMCSFAHNPSCQYKRQRPDLLTLLSSLLSLLLVMFSVPTSSIQYYLSRLCPTKPPIHNTV